MEAVVDWNKVEVGDFLTFEDGKVVAVRGIIDQEDQWVLQLSDGSDMRIPKIVSAEHPDEDDLIITSQPWVNVTDAESATLPTEDTRPPEPQPEGP